MNDYGYSFEVNNLLWEKDQEIKRLKKNITTINKIYEDNINRCAVEKLQYIDRVEKALELFNRDVQTIKVLPDITQTEALTMIKNYKEILEKSAEEYFQGE